MAPLELPTVQGEAVREFVVLANQPWHRHVRIAAGGFTLDLTERLLPGSTSPWRMMTADHSGWMAAATTGTAQAGAADTLMDALLDQALDVTTFQLGPLMPNAFEESKRTRRNLRTAFRYVGAATDAYIVLRLSDDGAIIIEDGRPVLHSLTTPQCDLCTTETSACRHTHLVQQTRPAIGLSLAAHAVADIASGAATVALDPAREDVALISLPECPELTLEISRGNPWLDITAAGQAWSLGAQALVYGIPESDIRRLMDAAELHLVAQGKLPIRDL